MIGNAKKISEHFTWKFLLLLCHKILLRYLVTTSKSMTMFTPNQNLFQV